MVYIPQEKINEIREQIDIVDLIGHYVDLNKRGNNYIASCPFHEDKNPSFSVSQEKQIFKCFSCGRGGNIYSFLQELEGLSFPEAVAKAAEFNNTPLDSQYLEQNTISNELKYLYDINKFASEFYNHYLLNTVQGETALNYLLNRGIDEQTIINFQIGLAPSKSDLLFQYLKDKNFTEEQMIQSGIFYRNKIDVLTDRFTDRIVFPLNNIKGDNIAFSGRIYKENQKDLSKYLNTNDTAIFNKSEIIYNFHRAKGPIRSKGYVLVCEGYMDVIALSKFGFENAIATMGTSLTAQHIQSISKITNTLYFVFDGDEAGQKATSRAIEMTKSFPNLIAKTIVIPNSMDPDEWLKNYGSESFENLIHQALSSYDFEKNYLKRNYNLKDEQSLSLYIEKLIEIVSTINSPIEQQIRIQDIANEFNISRELINEQVVRKKVGSSNEHSNFTASDTSFVKVNQNDFIKSKSAFQSEKIVLFNLIYFSEAWDFIEKLPQPLIMFHEISQKIFFVLQEYYYDEGNLLPLAGVVDKIHDTKMKQILTSIVWEQEKVAYNEKILEDCIQIINKAFIIEEISDLRQKMDQYKIENNMIEVNKIMTQIMHLMRKIK